MNRGNSRSMGEAISVLLLGSVTVGCASTPPQSFHPPAPIDIAHTHAFPADASLDRPEDAVLLPDGRLVVADKAHGLRVVLPDGTNRPFASLNSAGWRFNAKTSAPLSNGVSLAADGEHIIVTDVIGGEIWKVDIAREHGDLLFTHEFGVNTARLDSHGGLWFTQSTQVTPEGGHDRLLAPFNDPSLRDGVLWHLPAGSSDPNVVLDDLCLANGLAIDEQDNRIYVVEMIGDRVWHASVDLATGAVGAWTAVSTPLHPDNIELDNRGGLWVTCPSSRQLGVIDLSTEQWHQVMDIPTAAACGLPTGLVINDAGQLHAVTGLGSAVLLMDDWGRRHAARTTGIEH